MKLALLIGAVISTLGWGGFSGSPLWWLVAVILVAYGFWRRNRNKCSRYLELSTIMLGVVVPLVVYDGPVHLGLSIGLGIAWILIHIVSRHPNAPSMIWHKELILVLFGYGSLLFFLSVMRGGWWLFGSWLGFGVLSALLSPCYIRACGSVVSNFEVWTAVFLFWQVLLILYFLPLPWMTLVVLCFLCYALILHELAMITRRDQWWPGMGIRLAALCALVCVLFFATRL